MKNKSEYEHRKQNIEAVVGQLPGRLQAIASLIISLHSVEYKYSRTPLYGHVDNTAIFFRPGEKAIHFLMK